jgi:NADPH:quinone reductase-like Zn-dependent oxidoreductase
VVALGAGVTDEEPGDRVVLNANLGCGKCEYCLAGQDNRCQRWGILGETRSGTYAEYITVPVRNLYPIPPHFDERSAAAAALAFQTAWHSLIVRGRLHLGESVLVVGASGGVNTASIQIARLAGATVFVVGSSPEKLALAELLGAHHLIDRSKDENWPKAVYQLTDKRGVDVVVDNVGVTFPLSFRRSKRRSHLDSWQYPAVRSDDNRYIFAKHLSLIGSTMSTRAEFKTVMELVYAGQLKPVLDRSFPLSEARAAQDRMESGQQMGKITLEIG